MSRVLAVAELKGGTVGSAAREVVSVARGVADALGGTVHAVATGGQDSAVGDASAAADSAADLARYGADAVLLADADSAARGAVGGQAAQLAEAVRARGCEVVLLAATTAGKDLAPRVAAKLGVSLLSDATALHADEGGLVVTRPVFAGKALARIRPQCSPVVVSLRPNVFPSAEAPRELVTKELPAASPGEGDRGYRVTGIEAAADAAVDVSEAAIVVSGGRGMKGPEHWHLLEDLRDALGETAALGASRAVVDAGWRPHAEQVGQTGKTVTPKLYFALGISGAIQHLAGMRTSGVIVAVNRDPDAPIFGVADYGIVGDAFEVIPELAAAIRRLRES